MNTITTSSSPGSRRNFLKTLGIAGGASALGATLQPAAADHHKGKALPFKISLAEWSLHKTIFGGKLKNAEFAEFSKKNFGIDAIEYVNQFFKTKAKDKKYLGELKKRGEDAGVKALLIMIDGEGQLGAPDDEARKQTVENHKQWVEAAKFLGCHSIRVNAASKGTPEEQMKLAADGLQRLCDFAHPFGIKVIIENHGGLSSNGEWLAGMISKANRLNGGSLPDFGNFGKYDRYKGVDELMPFAHAVSAKSHEFNDKGDEVRTDYYKMMDIVLRHGYHGYVGIEYEGNQMPEVEGIKATQKLLQKIQQIQAAI